MTLRQPRGGIRAILGVCAVLAMFGGCRAVGPLTDASAGTSSFAYRAGTASQGFPVAPAEVRKVAVDALGDLRISSIRETIEPDTTLILDGTTGDGRSARLTIRPFGAFAVTTARVGFLGDEALSKAIMDRIGIRLGTMPPSAIPAEVPTGAQSPIQALSNKKSISDTSMIRNQFPTNYHDSPSDDPYNPRFDK